MQAALSLVTRLEAPAGVLHLRLAGDIGAVAAALPALQRFAADHDVSPRAANRLEVVFEELVSNAIRHGFAPQSGQSLLVWLQRAGDVIRLEIEDDGVRFDPLTSPQPEALTDLDSAPEGGLGIALVRKLAARIDTAGPPMHAGMVNRIIVELAAV